MYLTRMELDIAKRKTIMALASPAHFHGAIERVFAEKGGNLWRVDTLNGKYYLLLLSREQPDLSNVKLQFGTEKGWETLDYTRFLSNIHDGDRRGFRLKANPVITKSAGTGHRGEVLAHITPEQQSQWLLTRAENNGFHLATENFMVVQNVWESFQKGNDGGKRVTFRAVTFEGELTITDANLFRKTLQYGIGREKAYGCGLLTVTRRR